MQALGIIETYGFIAAVEASDAALKAANVTFQGMEFVSSGIITVTLRGDVGAVKAAVSAGCSAATLIGEVRGSHVIPRLAQGIEQIMLQKNDNHAISSLPTSSSEIPVIDILLDNNESKSSLNVEQSHTIATSTKKSFKKKKNVD